jgi:hypothetical protein
MRFLAETEHLRIFESDSLDLGEFCRPKVLYVGLPLDDAVVHCAMPVVNALVSLPGEPDSDVGLPYPCLDWLETCRCLEEDDPDLAQEVRDEFMQVVLEHLPGLAADMEFVDAHFRDTLTAIQEDAEDRADAEQVS